MVRLAVCVSNSPRVVVCRSNGCAVRVGERWQSSHPRVGFDSRWSCTDIRGGGGGRRKSQAASLWLAGGKADRRGKRLVKPLQKTFLNQLIT